MSESEELKQRLFNTHCAKIMEYSAGTEYHNKTTYYDKQSRVVCRVAAYDPYNNIQQILPIIDSLISAIGLSLKSGTIQREGLQVACRELILGTILTEEDKKDLGIVDDVSDITKDVVENEHDHLYREMLASHPLSINPNGGLDDMYHKLKDISDSFQIETILPHADDNKEVIKGCVGKERFWEADEEIQKIERFNKFCAKTMGWVQGTGRLADGYFMDNNSNFNMFECGVEDYNPWDDLTQLQPVIDILADSRGLTVYPQEAIYKGVLRAGRDAVSKFIPEDDEGIPTKAPLDSTLEFNKFCALTMWIDVEERYNSHEVDTGAHITTVLHTVDDNRLYDPYNDIKQLGIVIQQLYGINNPNCDPFDPEDKAGAEDKFIMASWRNYVIAQMPSSNPWQWIPDTLDFEESWDEYDRMMNKAVDVSDEMGEDWKQHAEEVVTKNDTNSGWGNDGALANIMWDNLMGRNAPDDTKSKTVPEAINNLADAIDALPTPIHEGNCANFGYDEYNRDYPDTKTEQGKFNYLCREIVFGHARAQGGHLTLPQAYDPYNNASETINVFEIVLQYLPSSIKFPISGRAEWDDPTNQNILKDMQNFIRQYGIDEYLLPPAETFHNLCVAIIEAYDLPVCFVDFDPYDNIADLAEIFPTVLEAADEEFYIPCGVIDGNPPIQHNNDVHAAMIKYVKRHGQFCIDRLVGGRK